MSRPQHLRLFLLQASRGVELRNHAYSTEVGVTPLGGERVNMNASRFLDDDTRTRLTPRVNART